MDWFGGAAFNQPFAYFEIRQDFFCSSDNLLRTSFLNIF